jgi:membrane protease YdiL (CAAX protease family)
VTARAAFWGRAKATGRAIVWIAAFALVGGAASWALSRLGPAPSPGWWLAWGALSSAVGFALATWLVGRVLDHRSWAELGWRPRGGVPRALGAGTALGAVMAAGAVGLALLAGGARFTATGEWAGWGKAALPLGVGFLLAALTEELMFRGYPLRRLADALGAGPATAVGAIGFGLAHLGNPSATAFSTLNVALAGVWLACAFFSPGAMPLAWGAHFGWNATLALGFRAPVSGYAFPVPAVAYRAGARSWIDGGAFGPEGGIVATLVMLAGTAAVVLWSRRAVPTLRDAERGSGGEAP